MRFKNTAAATLAIPAIKKKSTLFEKRTTAKDKTAEENALHILTQLYLFISISPQSKLLAYTSIKYRGIEKMAMLRYVGLIFLKKWAWIIFVKKKYTPKAQQLKTMISAA
jgi:hypothetical protein